MKAEQLEKAINSLLQQRVNFTINNKIIKSGKLILFCIKDFYLVFTIGVNHSKKMFEIPYPYFFDQYTNKIILNYNYRSQKIKKKINLGLKKFYRFDMNKNCLKYLNILNKYI